MNKMKCKFCPEDKPFESSDPLLVGKHIKENHFDKLNRLQRKVIEQGLKHPILLKSLMK